MKGYKRYRAGAWRIEVNLGTSLDGKRRRLTRTVRAANNRTGERQAETVLAALIAEASAGRHEPTSQATFGEVIDRWLGLSAADWSPSTLATNTSNCRNHIIPALGHLRVDKIRVTDLEAFYADLTREGLRPATVRRIHNAVSRALTTAERWGHINRNPARVAHVPKAPSRSIDPPDPADVGHALVVLEQDHPTLAVFVRLYATTGARRGQLAGLQWGDIDSAAPAITFTRAIALGPDGPVVKSTKTDRPYRVAIDADTLAALDAHKVRMNELALRVGVGATPWVFPAPTDPRQAVRPDAMTRDWSRMRADCGLPDTRLHDLRHGVATHLLAAGVDVRTVAGRLGHANPNVTLNTYAHFLPEADRDAAEVISGLVDRRLSCVR